MSKTDIFEGFLEGFASNFWLKAEILKSEGFSFSAGFRVPNGSSPTTGGPPPPALHPLLKNSPLIRRAEKTKSWLSLGFSHKKMTDNPVVTRNSKNLEKFRNLQTLPVSPLGEN